MRLKICCLVLSGVLGTALALAQQSPLAHNPCAAAVSKAGSPATLFKKLRLGVFVFKYQDQEHGGIHFSAKAFLAGRTDLLPVRWQVLRLWRSS